MASVSQFLVVISLVGSLAAADVPRGFSVGEVQISGNASQNPIQAIMGTVMGSVMSQIQHAEANAEVNALEGSRSNNSFFGGPPMTSETGSEIMQSIIGAFLANRPLAKGEKDCLIFGSGSMGGQVVKVSSELMNLASQMVQLHHGAVGDLFDASASKSRPNAMSKHDSDTLYSGSDDASQRLHTPAVMGKDGPANVIDGMGLVMMFGHQMSQIMGLGHQIMDSCLEGDGKAALQEAASNAQNFRYVSQHVLGNGADLCVELADALQAWKSGEANLFGKSLGSMMRKMFLSGDVKGLLPEGLPDKTTLLNVTSGFLEGFFGPGMKMSINTPETDGQPIQVDLHKCVGKNAGLLQSMWSSMMSFYGQQSSLGRARISAYNQPPTKLEFATRLAYAAMQLPRALELCNVDEEKRGMLEDAIRGMGKGSDLEFQVPQSGSISKTEAASKMASTVGDYEQMVQDPTQSSHFGSNVGQLFRQMLQAHYSQKYVTDVDGNLKKQILALETATQRQPIGSGPLIALLLVALLFVLSLSEWVVLKSRHALVGHRGLYRHHLHSSDVEAPADHHLHSSDVEAPSDRHLITNDDAATE
eukprot:TRINITY_DN644_c0_g1_i1.p1 TRINITY_DN644_c0_g1~~TRINITY_DN644_c0_g1_i1.p1  ORF type:complete len:588 (+),score=109.64 TRINITY_DN644_c0_g1_i1:84-1847(+)